MSASASPSRGSREHTLLVISSDRANLELMTQVLIRSSDFLLLTARNGTDGMTLANEVLPTAVVVDTGLSDVCAKAMLKTLKENPETSKIPVIAVSADAQGAQVQAGLNAGFYRYVTKPFRLSHFMDAIDDSIRYSLGSKGT